MAHLWLDHATGEYHEVPQALRDDGSAFQMSRGTLIEDYISLVAETEMRAGVSRGVVVFIDSMDTRRPRD